MLVFSTHAFTEGDTAVHGHDGCYCYSQLTPSRKATCLRRSWMHRESKFSTHAFTEGDLNGLVDVDCFLDFSTHAFTEGDDSCHTVYFHAELLNSRLHGRRLQIQIIFAAKHFLFLLILSKFLILAFLFHLASLRFSLHPVIFRCESPCIFLFIYLSHSKHVHSVIIFNLLHYISPLIFYQLKICFNLISLLFKINLLKFFVIFYWHRKMPVIKFIKF